MKSDAQLENERLIAAEKAEAEREARAREWEQQEARSVEFFRKVERERATDLVFVI